MPRFTMDKYKAAYDYFTDGHGGPSYFAGVFDIYKRSLAFTDISERGSTIAAEIDKVETLLRDYVDEGSDFVDDTIWEEEKLLIFDPKANNADVGAVSTLQAAYGDSVYDQVDKLYDVRASLYMGYLIHKLILDLAQVESSPESNFVKEIVKFPSELEDFNLVNGFFMSKNTNILIGDAIKLMKLYERVPSRKARLLEEYTHAIEDNRNDPDRKLNQCFTRGQDSIVKYFSLIKDLHKGDAMFLVNSDVQLERLRDELFSTFIKMTVNLAGMNVISAASGNLYREREKAKELVHIFFEIVGTTLEEEVDAYKERLGGHTIEFDKDLKLSSKFKKKGW